ncbi:hypothetical protein TRFO_14633 [Tritrichomonas foetus]|uniref:Uncharacterized protein n=1 Tax=Tritrichomonas foetus TaxID=1144522 RepID=A0A1J4KUL1_9EUKA|nr:hypothetical protein TRFO_14633 [Tritrichomonas foetus]|eukprot:OHT14969.1 hypothetical protein TRFO_14633 [Tritrichomonas foetus]
MSNSRVTKTPPRSPRTAKSKASGRSNDSPGNDSSASEEAVLIVNEEREALRKKLIQDAKDLLDYVVIEMTVGSQIESTKKQIKELTKLCRDENRTIVDLEKQIHEEELKAEMMDQEGFVDDDMNDDKNIDTIVELERQLKALYAEKAELLNKRQKKKK